jgi:hypothetical protein
VARTGGTAPSRPLWLRGSEVLAGMHANDWDAMDSIRKIVGRVTRGETWGTNPCLWLRSPANLD